ncbi:MAG: ECF transporter S component [Firmicutes bacterium]|nr:ECF transporter S component [Bacillota bacterium]
MKNMTAKDVAMCALVAALTFIFTYAFKIPVANGYVHLGDSFIFLGVFLLGRKKACMAGGLGAALADLIGGYAVWVVPTFIIKTIMAYTMGTITEVALKENKNGHIAGMLAGGVVQVVLYTAVNILVFGMAFAGISCFSDVVQTLTSVVMAVVFISSIKRTSIYSQIKNS